MNPKWTSQERIARVMEIAGCDEKTARDYLIAEEGDERDAIDSIIGDRRMEAKAKANTYRVTVNIDGERMTYYCDSAGEVGALREAFEKVHGSSIDVVIMDQRQNRRIY